MAFWIWLWLAAAVGAAIGWAVAYPLGHDAGYLEGRRDGRNAYVDELRQRSAAQRARVLERLNRKGRRA